MSTHSANTNRSERTVPDEAPANEAEAESPGVVIGYPVPQQPSNSANSGAIVVAGPCVASGVDEWQSNNNLLHEQNNTLLNELRQEQGKLPYVSVLEPLGALKSEYQSGSEIFVRKIEKLEQSFAHLRRTRGDGNCFFRAFLFSYIEGLLLSNDLEECKRFSACIQGWHKKLADAGFQEIVFEDAMELLLEMVNSIGRPIDPLTVELLEINFRDDMASNLMVMLVRFITSAEVQLRQDFFLPFIMGMYDDPPASMEIFCRRMVEPMGEESDHIHIVALTDALEVPCTVVYLDRSGAEAFGAGSGSGSELDVTVHQFLPEACPPNSKPRATVLYRPGHYDVLYPL